jgi:hypothetical protein
MPNRKARPSHPRRGSGEGAVYYDEARDLWCAAVELGEDADGKRQREVVTARRKDDALAKLRAVHDKQAKGLPMPNARQSTAA